MIIVVPLGGWISRQMAIILISTNYVYFQLARQLLWLSLSLSLFLSLSLRFSLFLFLKQERLQNFLSLVWLNRPPEPGILMLK